MKHNAAPLLLLLSLALALPGLAPVGAAAAGAPAHPHSDETHPWVMQQAAEQVATARVGNLAPFQPAAVGGPGNSAVGSGGYLHRRVFGFGLFSSLADPTYGYPSWNFNLLSTVAVFGLHIQTDGHISPDSGYSVWSSSQMTGLLSTAHQSSTKVEVSIVLQDFSTDTPSMCYGLMNRANTVSQTVAEVQAKGVDGVNIDYEGFNFGSCPNGQSPRSMLVDLARQLRAALPSSSSLSIDTYASSAGDPYGFFDIPGLNNYVDTFFVMAYDSDWSNFGYPPLSCSRYCLNPVAPLTGYNYNDTRATNEYVSAVAASKVVLGVPYYSRGACTNNWGYNAYPVAGTGTWALDYFGTTSMATDPTNANYQTYRDPNDPAGQEPLATWTSTNTSCTPMEMYYDDPTSFGKKYDLVNRSNLGGVGIWNLNQGGGSADLWTLLRTYFGGPYLVISTSTATVTAGVSINVTVTAKSVSATTDTAYAGTVHFVSTDGAASLPGDYTFTGVDQGAHTFPVTLKTAGNQILTVSDTASPSNHGTAAAAVSAAAASHLAVAAPGGTLAGSPFNFSVTALDPFGNLASGYSGTVQFSSNDPQATLPPNSSLNQGSGTFSATLRTSGTHSLTGTDTGSAVSGTAAVAVTPGPPASLGVSAPATAVTGNAISFTVTARDQYGNVAPSDNDMISFSSSDSLAQLPPPSNLAAGAGTYNATLGTPGTVNLGATDAAAGLHAQPATIAVTRGGTVQSGGNPPGTRAPSTPPPALGPSAPPGLQSANATPSSLGSNPAPSQAAMPTPAPPGPTAATGSAKLTPAQSPDHDSRLTARSPAGAAGQRQGRGWIQGAWHLVVAVLRVVMEVL